MADANTPARPWISSAPIVVYTLARKFPETINRLPDGRKIPGGPYTLTGFVTALALLFGGLRYAVPLINTLSGNSVMGFLTVPAAAVGAGVAVSRLPVEGRNPVQLVSGFAAAAISPRYGVIDGRAVKTVATRTYDTSVQVLDVPDHMTLTRLSLAAAHEEGTTTSTDVTTAAAVAALTKEARRAA